jgi:hypothetical protein
MALSFWRQRITLAAARKEIDPYGIARWAGYHRSDGFFPAGHRARCACRTATRAPAQIKIVSNESGRKKFLLNRFWRELGARHHFSAAMNVLASRRLTHPTTQTTKSSSLTTFNK